MHARAVASGAPVRSAGGVQSLPPHAYVAPVETAAEGTIVLDARITGNIVGDEETLGTIHFAFGTNTTIGGTNRASVHIDRLVLDPSVEFDGTSLNEGRTIVE